MNALAYLEWCYARHQFAQILRSPLRLVIWVPYALLIFFLVYSRMFGHHAVSVGFELLPTLATTIGGFYLVMLGVTIGAAASGRVAVFRSNAEAVLFSNAGVRPLTVAVWLQLRKLATSWTRWLGGFIYLFAIAAPHGGSPLSVVRAFVAAALALAAQMTIELPVFLLSRGRWREPLRILGWTIAAVGAVFAGGGLFGPRVLDPIVAFTKVDPGTAVDALLRGSTIATMGLATLVAFLIFSITILGDDAMPELVAASRNMLAERRRRTNPAREHFTAPKTAARARIPTGALALECKDWVGFRRDRGALVLLLAGCVVWSLVGAAVAYGAARWQDQSPIYILVSTTALLVLVMAPYVASVGLANDLSKPLFWLSRSSLQERLAAWTLGRAWRGGTALGLGPLVAGLMAGDIALAIIAVPLTLTTYWSLQALGVGLYAIFPNPLDSRGPVMMLRLFLTVIYIVPAAIVTVVCTVAGGGPYLGAFAFVATLGIEGWFVLIFASMRFSEYGASLATISRAT